MWLGHVTCTIGPWQPFTMVVMWLGNPCVGCWLLYRRLVTHNLDSHCVGGCILYGRLVIHSVDSHSVGDCLLCRRLVMWFGTWPPSLGRRLFTKCWPSLCKMLVTSIGSHWVGGWLPQHWQSLWMRFFLLGEQGGCQGEWGNQLPWQPMAINHNDNYAP